MITLVSMVPEMIYVFSGQTPFDIAAAEAARTGRAVGGITRLGRVLRMMQIVASLTTIFIKFRGSKKSTFGICPLKCITSVSCFVYRYVSTCFIYF